MPNRGDYQPLAQDADEDVDNTIPEPPAKDSSPHSKKTRQRGRSGHIDIRKLDAAFKRWTESIAQKVKGKKKTRPDDSRKETMRSVFDPYIPSPGTPPGFIKTWDHNAPMTQADCDRLVLSIRRAILEGVHPKMISKGSSGSYFARAKVDGKVQTVAVFKPKDEEPYGHLNPKTTKWLHRQFRWIIPFGRSCLIPNLSYISEAAASLLDDRLGLNIVPKTQLASFSSPVFFYDWLDRNAAKKGKTLPEKIGSLQCFMHGYQDASEFLRNHPWPGRPIRDTFDDSSHRTGKFSRRFLSALKVICGKAGDEDINDVEDPDEERALYDASEENMSNHHFYWTTALQQSFREELEKLVILDYIMHNTDRGADNYMIKYCEGDHEKLLVDVAPTRSSTLQLPMMNELRKESTVPRTPNVPAQQPSGSRTVPTTKSPPGDSPYVRQPHIHIAAIDNSLAFPHEHPKGQPFSQKTRDHFLPLLTSKVWWEETVYQLRKLFAVDPDFNRKMFQRQLAVIKGQAYNVVQSLKHHDEGPLELTRRQKFVVWDDEVEITDEIFTETTSHQPASPKPSIMTLPVSLPQSPQHRRTKSQTTVMVDRRAFPPPVRRVTESRPVPFASKLPRVHPGTSGVTVLEHMERVDAVEAGLRRLAVSDGFIQEEGVDEQEIDVSDAVPNRPALSSPIPEHVDESDREGSETPKPPQPDMLQTPPLSPISDGAGPSHHGGQDSLTSSLTEEDLVAMSRSTSAIEPGGSTSRPQFRSQDSVSPNGVNRLNLDWIREEESVEGKRIVINERIEVVKSKAFFSFC